MIYQLCAIFIFYKSFVYSLCSLLNHVLYAFLHTYVSTLIIIAETLENGHNIDELISHGIDLLSNLLPESASGDELRSVIMQCLSMRFGYGLLSFIVQCQCDLQRTVCTVRVRILKTEAVQ